WCRPLLRLRPLPYTALFRSAMAALRADRQRDGRPLGELFGDALRNSMNTLLFVGGSIVMFSVILEVLSIAGVVGIAGQLLARDPAWKSTRLNSRHVKILYAV